MKIEIAFAAVLGVAAGMASPAGFQVVLFCDPQVALCVPDEPALGDFRADNRAEEQAELAEHPNSVIGAPAAN